MFNKSILNLQQNIKILIWKNNKIDNYYNIFLFNNEKKLSLFIDKNQNKISIDKNTNSIIIIKNNLNEFNNKIDKKIFYFLKSWDIYFFNKIKFKGKGFRIRFLKKNKFVKFFFGKSHKTFILFKKIIMKKISKYKFIIKSITKNKIKKNSYITTKIKPLNLYTLRGLRSSRQIIFKRKGKKGTYI